jgi:putative ABC transport system permease protein
MRAERHYRRLLVVLPSSFRAEAEPELLAMFRDAHARAADTSRMARLRFWLVLVLDLVVTAALEWQAVLSRRGMERAADMSRRHGVNIMNYSGWAVRYLLRRPSRSVLAAVTLALGISTTVVGLVLVRGVLLSPLPFPDAERLVRLREVDETGRVWWPSFPNIVDWRTEGTRVLGSIGATDDPSQRPVLWDGQAQRLVVSAYSRGLLETLRVDPVAGRDFTALENARGGPPVAVISWEMWRNRLNGRPLEQLALTIGAEQFGVVGVLPQDFRFFAHGGAWGEADVFLPLEREDLGPRTAHGYNVVGRLRDGVTLADARSSFAALARRLREAHGEPTQAHSVMVTAVFDDVVGGVRAPLKLLMGAALLVLLIACLNVGGTLLAEGMGRDRELAVRLAIGARRRDLLAQLMVESAALALPGAVLGAVLATGTLEWLRRLQTNALPRLENAAMDGPTLAITLGVALLAALIAGVVPAVILSSRELGSRLRGSMGLTTARSTQRLWSGFIAVQTALTLVLLFGGALLLRSMIAAVNVPVGYDAQNVLAVSVSLPESRYSGGSQRPRFYETLLERVRALPDVEAAGISSKLPHEVWDRTASTGRSGGDQSHFAAYRLVDPGYFDALGVPVLRGGREAATSLASGEALIDETLARIMHATGPVVGGLVTNSYQEGPMRVVGTVGEVREWSMAEGMPTIYIDYRTRPDMLTEMHMFVRVRGNMSAIADDVRAIITDLDPMVPVAALPLRAHLSTLVADRRLILGMIAGFAVIALCLAAVAMYSMVSFVVGRHRREMGIRVSLGARPAQVIRDTMRNGVMPAVIGTGAGVAAALMLGTLLESQLFNVAPRDPVALGVASVLLVFTAVCASALPARAAAKVDPVSVLRIE